MNIEKGKRYTVEYKVGRKTRSFTGVYLGTGRIGARGQEVAFDLRPDHGTTNLWTADVVSIVPAGR